MAAAVATCAMGWAAPAPAAPPTPYTAGKAVKLDVLGEWAHPDDDTSIIGPCGVWHDRYGTRCGIIMITRGEGGGNAVGTEIGPALGLRRENEDRVAHYRSGTVDIFNLDKVDFFYNTSAPLTQRFWGHEDTLRRVVRIIRMTQPEVYLGFTPSLNAGHGNHQQAGRYIWEGMKAAADPTRFPGQLKANGGTLSTWQVKKVFSGGSTQGTGGTTDAPNCTTGFTPAATNLDTVAGVWTGYDSPYRWPAGNIAGMFPGTPKSWEQIHAEGTAAYPTQSRVMRQDAVDPACRRFGMTASFVPFQPNVNPDGTLNPRAGRDDAIFHGASVRDPGGMPKGTLEHLTSDRFYNAPGVPFEVTLHARSGQGTIPAGTVALNVPAGWSVDSASKPIGAVGTSAEQTVTFTVTPAAGAAVNTNFRISALWTSGTRTGYTDQVVRVVSPVEGRFQRWGKWAEYDEWLEETAPEARRIGRSAAIQTVGVGQDLEVPVVVRNWTQSAQTGDVTLTLPAGVTADHATKSYGTLSAGEEKVVTFTLSNTFTNATLPAGQNVTVGIATSYDQPSPGSGSENLTLTVVPRTAIPTVPTAPDVDGQPGAAYDAAEKLDIGKVWQGATGCADAADCGRSDTADADANWAKVVQSGDALYFFVHVRDDFQSYAVTPAECVGHWQADAVELLIDPRGNSAEQLTDTASTFKLGVFPYTNDPSGSNGNGANGPCWSRDADNHQGYSTGPLANTVDDAPNAPGVQVASTARWVGTNETTTSHAYAGGGYDLEVKIPIANLPAKPDPDRLGLNITPYDNDDTSAPGTTTLRHIDQSTRLGWSALGSVQSDPYRWGRATLPGYTPPAGMPEQAPPSNVSHPNLDGTESPQTIWNSAHSGVPISGREPAPANDRIDVTGLKLGAAAAEFDIVATGPGTARVYLWSGVEGYIPVWTTTCSPQDDPPPDHGLTACSASDGGIPPWGTDMSGRVVQSVAVQVTGAGTRHVVIPLSADQRAKLARDGSALISFETPNDEVQAFDLPLAQVRVSLTGATSEEDGMTDLRAAVAGTPGFPGMPTGTVQFRADGEDLGGPVALEDGVATLSVATARLAGRTVRAVYSGDGDYLGRSVSRRLVDAPAQPPAAGKPKVLTKNAKVRQRGFTVTVRCPARPGGACEGTLKVRTNRKVAGKRRTFGPKAFAADAGTSVKVTFKVPRKAARWLRGRTVGAKATVTDRDANGATRRTTSSLKLKG